MHHHLPEFFFRFFFGIYQEVHTSLAINLSICLFFKLIFILLFYLNSFLKHLPGYQAVHNHLAEILMSQCPMHTDTHTHTQTHSAPYTHTHSAPPAPPPTHTHTHSAPYTHTHTHIHTVPPPHTHTNTYTQCPTHTHTHTVSRNPCLDSIAVQRNSSFLHLLNYCFFCVNFFLIFLHHRCTTQFQNYLKSQRPRIPCYGTSILCRKRPDIVSKETSYLMCQHSTSTHKLRGVFLLLGLFRQNMRLMCTAHQRTTHTHTHTHTHHINAQASEYFCY